MIDNNLMQLWDLGKELCDVKKFEKARDLCIVLRKSLDDLIITEQRQKRLEEESMI